MSEIAVQVIHLIPGRIRVRLPVLKHNPDYGAVLQKQVQSLAAVKAVRVNPTAESMTIEYNPHSTSEADFSTAVVTAIQSTSLADLTFLEKTNPAERASGSFLPPDCEVIQLTPYEEAQFEAIKTWKHRKLSGLKEIMGHLLMAAKGLLNFLFLNLVLEKIASVCESATAGWQRDWEKLKSLAGVEDAIALRQSPLETCDRLSEHVMNVALEKAAAQGSISGLLNVFGEIANEELTLVLALQTIHRIGLCYGYPPQTSDEQALIWAIFNAAIALTQEEYEKTQALMRSIQRSLNKQALEDETLKDMLEEDVDEMLVDSAIEQGIAQLSGETFAGVVPVLNIVMNVFADRDLIEQISTAAKREFQLRWLLENRKVRFPEPSTP